MATTALTVAEREARGRTARADVPRSSHAGWEPAPGRPDPIALLEQQERTRVPELVPIRHGRMLASPFAFFRGGALIMASDLASTPRSGMDVQLCGDAHLSNFGVFATPERNLVFDINDFDETHPGPWEWDLKRLAASLVVVARERGFPAKEGRAAAVASVREYRGAMRTFAGMSNLDVWHASYTVEDVVERLVDEYGKAGVAETESAIAKARSRDNLRAFAKLTETVDGVPRIIDDPPLVVRVENLARDVRPGDVVEEVRDLLRGYRRTLQTDRRVLLEQYRVVDVARKVVGVGSVGTRTWIALLVGRDDRDPLFLQVKEAEPSVLERFLGRSSYDNSGHRVVAGQRLMQAASDLFLGWNRTGADLDGTRRDSYVRQLYDWKGHVDIERIAPSGFDAYGRLCGSTLARAHARSGDRIAVAAYLGSGGVFDHAVADFAERYADQNERDYAAFEEAVRSGRVEAETGV
jgi:uncharacterized protein (DUF2252 family)